MKVQRGLNELEEKLANGNRNPGTGRKHIYKDIVEHRHRSGARLYVRERPGVIEILAKSSKQNQKSVIKKLKEIY